MNRQNAVMSSAPQQSGADSGDPIRDVIRQYWGYDTLRPLQYEAMSAALAGRDALVVLPTGGGKSLCYQAPALLANQPTVVVSPLISLMKDQVDALIARGVSTAFLNSSLTIEDRRRVAAGIAESQYKLIFVAPERFASEAFWNLLETGGVGSFAIDEAHCISHWGHDFRSDYRRLDQLKVRFPNAAVHAFTATATPRVRDDIVEQLKLDEPKILVGDFFRPNLTYRVQRRGSVFDDVLELLQERKGQAGIVYCIRRRDVDEMTVFLKSAGINAEGYHAGLSDAARTGVQDRFASLRTDVVVATVAFGMGIDRSDIRFVIHAAMPQSIEHYQQETGRAGRDGQPADCIMLYNGRDIMVWKSIISRDGEGDLEIAMPLLDAMARFCTGVTCRHKSLVTYFGQRWTIDDCGACDVCGDHLPTLEDSTVRAQKIMSAVYRTGQRYGAAYVCDVLAGKETPTVQQRGHASIPTFGVMAEDDKRSLMAWIDQLVDQQMLEREPQYRVLSITETGWQVLRSKTEARLLPTTPKRSQSRSRKRADNPPANQSRSRQRAGKTSRTRGTRTNRVARSPDPAPLAQSRERIYQAMGRDLNCPACGYSLIGNTTGVCSECSWQVDFETIKVTRADFASVAARRAGVKHSALEPARRCDRDEPQIAADDDANASALFEKLREVRQTIAKEINKPAFVVFSDRTLRNIAAAKPTTPDAMLAVSGVGPAKLETYGEPFLAAVAEFIREYSV